MAWSNQPLIVCVAAHFSERNEAFICCYRCIEESIGQMLKMTLPVSVDANKELMTAWPAFKSSNLWSFKTDTTGSLPSPPKQLCNPSSWCIKTLPGIAYDKAAKHCSDSSSRTSHTNCGSTSTNELGSSVNITGNGAGLEGAGQDCRLADWQQGLGEDKRKCMPLAMRQQVQIYCNGKFTITITLYGWYICRSWFNSSVARQVGFTTDHPTPSV